MATSDALSIDSTPKAADLISSIPVVLDEPTQNITIEPIEPLPQPVDVTYISEPIPADEINTPPTPSFIEPTEKKKSPGFIRRIFPYAACAALFAAGVIHLLFGDNEKEETKNEEKPKEDLPVIVPVAPPLGAYIAPELPNERARKLNEEIRRRIALRPDNAQEERQNIPDSDDEYEHESRETTDEDVDYEDESLLNESSDEKQNDNKPHVRLGNPHHLWDVPRCCGSGYDGRDDGRHRRRAPAGWRRRAPTRAKRRRA